jgi:hypothetical protein
MAASYAEADMAASEAATVPHYLLMARQIVVTLAKAAVAACALSAAVSAFTSVMSGNPCDVTNFNIIFPGIDTPQTTEHISDAIATGQPSTLDYIRPGNSRAWLRTDPRCMGNVASVSGSWCDEYPFASTAQGGPGASLRLVPAWEQMLQGGLYSAFLSACKVLPNDPIEGTFGVVPQWGPTYWVCK